MFLYIMIKISLRNIGLSIFLPQNLVQPSPSKNGEGPGLRSSSESFDMPGVGIRPSDGVDTYVFGVAHFVGKDG